MRSFIIVAAIIMSMGKDIDLPDKIANLIFWILMVGFAMDVIELFIK